MKLFNFNSFILNENLLLEGRIENLKEKYKDKIDPNVINWFENSDPTPNNAYFEWLLKKYSTMDSDEKEKFEKLKTPIYKTFTKILKKFYNNKQKMSSSERDINSYKNLSMLLYKANEEDKDYSDSAIREYGSVDIHVNNEEWLIFTPYDYDVAEEYGHNNRGGTNWCVCYDQEMFDKYACPDGGITMIINKLDFKLDLAIQKSLDDKVTLWNYNDDSVSEFEYDSDGLLDYLKNPKHGDYEFVLDYYNNHEVDELKLSISDVEDSWKDAHRDNWSELLEFNHISDYLDFDCFSYIVFSDLRSSEEQVVYHIEDYFYKDFINYNYSSELEEMDDEEKDDLLFDSDKMREYIIDNGDWDQFFDDWMFDKDTIEFLEDFINEYDYSVLEDCVDIDSILNDAVENQDQEELISDYYQFNFLRNYH